MGGSTVKWLPWVLVVVLLLVVTGQLGIEGRLRERIRTRDRQITALEEVAGILRDTLQEQVAQLDAVTDTLWLPQRRRVDSFVDSIPVPVEVVREIVAAADTTIAACRSALSTCQQLAQVERARGDSLAEQVNDWRRVARGPVLRGEAGLFYRLDGGFVASPQLTARTFFGWTLTARADVPLDSLAGAQVLIGVSRAF